MLAQGKPVRRKLRNCPDLVSTDLLINGCESDKLVRVRHFPPAREENYKITDAYCVAYRRPTDTPRYLSDALALASKDGSSPKSHGQPWSRARRYTAMIRSAIAISNHHLRTNYSNREILGGPPAIRRVRALLTITFLCRKIVASERAKPTESSNRDARSSGAGNSSPQEAVT